MYRTRALLRPFSVGGSGGGGGGSNKNFIIPTESFWDVAFSALQGAWAHLNHQNSRDRYEQLVEKGVIRDTVLAQARNGSLLTMSLFHNLQNPLFEKYGFDAKDFVDAVGPAIEVFQDTLGQLVHEMNTSSEKDDDDKKEDASLTTGDIVFGKISGLGENQWRKQAQEDPNSLAAKFAKMTTDSNLNDHYYGAKLFRALTEGTRHSSMEYVTGSGVVNSVALLSARAMEQFPEDAEHPEFAASEGSTPVAARLEVLYEITQNYRMHMEPLSTSEQYSNVLKDVPSASTNKEPPPSSSSSSSNPSPDSSPKKDEQPKQESALSTDESQAETSSNFNLESVDKKNVVAESSAKKDEQPKQESSSSSNESQAETSSNSKQESLDKENVIADSSAKKDKQSKQESISSSEESQTETTSTSKESSDKKIVNDDYNGTQITSKNSMASDSNDKDKNDDDKRTISESMLAVAVFEGWLHGGPDKDLRWRVAMVRDAYEFP